MNFASDVSIRGAENFYTCWGNLRIGSMVVGEENSIMRVRGRCHDLESNVLIEKEATKFVGNFGANQKAVVEGALSSIAIRNAFMGNLPGYAKEEYKRAIIGKIGGSTPDEVKEFWGHAKKLFKTVYNLDERHLRLILDIGKDVVIEADHVAWLTGIHNALQDGIVELNEVLTESVPEPTKKKDTKKASSKTSAPTPEAEPVEPEKPKQTLKQQYNTLKLQMEEKFGAEETKNVLLQFQGKFKMLVAHFGTKLKDDQLEVVIMEMEKVLHAKEKE